MITVIRRQLKTALTQSVIGFFVIIFCIVFMLPDTINRVQSPEWVVKVNNNTVEYPEFARVINKHEINIRMIREQYGAYADMFIQMLGLAGDPKKVALHDLVRENVLNEVAQKIPLHIASSYIEQRINDPRLAQRSGIADLLPLGSFNEYGINQEALALYLSRTHMNAYQFDQLVDKALARNMVLELAGLASYVPSFMIDNATKSELSAKDYTILTIPFDKIKQEVLSKGISDAELTAFFDEENNRSKRYWIPEMRSATVWEFNPESYGITLADNAVEEYYETNRLKKYLEEPAKVQVRRILFKSSETAPKELLAQRAKKLRDELVQDPVAFESKAREHSDDKESAAKGGLLDLFAKGERDPVFERKAFMLSKDGEVSELFESADGYEIIQRVQRKAAKSKPLAEVQSEIRSTLLRQAFVQQFAKEAKKLINQEDAAGDSLTPFITEKHGKAIEVSLAPKDDSKRMQAIFKLKKEGRADFYVDGENGYIVVLKKIQHKHVPNLDAIKATVKEDVVNQQAQKLLLQRVKEAQNALKTEAVEHVANRFGASVKETGLIHKKDEDKIKQLKAEGIPTEKMFQIDNKGSIASAIARNGYIFYVSSLSEIDKEEYDKKKIETETLVNSEVMGLFVQGFVASLSRNAKIEINESLLNQIETQVL